ncbi:TetR/AcrR family transcriptional regulator [Paenibacillus alginolyticus]|uniref:TetR/AcrR family transcriptional regulator n=1 Tax=Paenibacillus alginolyticus TaxID=59839 RepID=UPI002DC03552|nr:TetR/AcrR family transcriptional regulator [Paenibacillus alginolyticus]
MDSSAISLRELKKARTKVALYEASLSLIGDKMFRDMMLDDICRKAEVSRVTFFKFYQKKEDLLVYFMRVWLTERIIEIEAEGKRGFSVIQHVLHKVAEETEERAGLMPSLISFLAEMNMHPCMPELSEAEVHLLFPDHVEVGAQTPDMFKTFSSLHDGGGGRRKAKKRIYGRNSGKGFVYGVLRSISDRSTIWFQGY